MLQVTGHWITDLNVDQEFVDEDTSPFVVLENLQTRDLWQNVQFQGMQYDHLGGVIYLHRAYRDVFINTSIFVVYLYIYNML